MSPRLILAVVCIMFALTFYTIGVFAERKTRILKKWHVITFYIGLVFDTVGTSLMGTLADESSKQGELLHGITGFIAIGLMIFHAVWATVTLRQADEKKLAAFHKFSLFVWLIWLVSFLTGMMMGMMG